MGPPWRSIRRPIAPWANALTTELHPLWEAVECYMVAIKSSGNRTMVEAGRFSALSVRSRSSRFRRSNTKLKEREMFYLTTHSTHFIYGYMASDIWLRTIPIVRKETRCRHIGYSYRLTARVLLYAPFHRQDNTYHGLCYTSGGALAGTRNSSMGPPHEGSIRRPIAPWANALPLSYVPLQKCDNLRVWFGCIYLSAGVGEWVLVFGNVDLFI